MRRVRLFGDWDQSSRDMLNSLRRQSIGFEGDVYRGELQYVTDDSYDHAVVFNFPRESLKTDAYQNLGLLLEPPEIVERFWPAWVDRKEVPGVDNYWAFCTGTRFPPVPGLGFATVDHFPAYPRARRKRACMIASNKLFTPYHYKRHEILGALLDSDLDIDFYGRGMPPSSNHRVKGEIAPGKKADVLRQYDYVIDFENSNQAVVTDKFFDAVLSGCVSITNAWVLEDIAPYHSVRLVNFERSTDSIVELIDDFITYAPTGPSWGDVDRAARSILEGRLSLANWIHEQIKAMVAL